MADDKSKTGQPDRARVNRNENYEVRHAASKTGATPDQLRKSAERAGPMRDDVEHDLRGRMKPRG